MTQKLYAFGLGLGTQNKQGEWLETFYPSPQLHPDPQCLTVLAKELGYEGGNRAITIPPDQWTRVRSLAPDAELWPTKLEAPAVATFLETDDSPGNVPEAFFKLHLISHRKVKPHGTDLSGLFKSLRNVAWTNEGPVDMAELGERQLAARAAGRPLTVHSVDKFPRMTDYVIPEGVRIGDAVRVRLGAYLGTGTTVMHEGFINFNAGCEGPNMIEGRISAGVMVGRGSDLGGGSSTMGTLSGGGKTIITIGTGCLVGANAGVGIPLGDECTVEAGLYLTASSKVTVLDKDGKSREVVKAAELAGRSQLLFRRNSQSGAIECLPNKYAVSLNEELHSHN